MPLCTIHLLALHPTTPSPILTFLSSLRSSTIKPLVISRVVRWIILPTTISTEHLLARNIHWDLFLVLPNNTSTLPPDVQTLIQHHWHITAGVPSRLTTDFGAKNAKLLHPPPSSVPTLVNQPNDGSKAETKESSQNLELSAGLEKWIQESIRIGGKEIDGAVSMFNLLAFKPDMKAEYLEYGKAFGERVGKRHGGDAKIVGNVIKPPHSHPSSSSTSSLHSSTATASSVGHGGGAVDAGADGWDEIALAHYPSILHFRDMLLSREYQEVNHRHRVPSLRDTCILMTSEVGVEEMVRGAGGAKL